MSKDMSADLSLTDKILLVFFASLAVAEEALNDLPTPRSIMRKAYGWDPEYFGKSKPTTVERVFFRLFERRFIHRIESGRSRQYKMTAEGFQYLYRKFPQLRLRGKSFDGFWRVVLYDIEEANRRLRREIRIGLKSLGFQRIQQSVWVSPYDWEGEMDELFRKLNLEDEVLIFKTKLSDSKTKKWLENLRNNSGDLIIPFDVSPSGGILSQLLATPQVPKGLV